MKGKRILSALLLLLLTLCLLPGSAAAAEPDPTGQEYMVTLQPGDGQGNVQVYISTFQGELRGGRENAGNCEFYVEADGSVGFKTEEGWFPSSWTTPEGQSAIAGWDDGEVSYHSMSQPIMTLNACWKRKSGTVSVEPQVIVLPSCGGDVDVVYTVDQLDKGDALGVYLDFSLIPPEDGDGHSVRISVRNEEGVDQFDYHFEPMVTSSGYEIPIPLVVNGQDCVLLRDWASGRYIGYLNYTATWLYSDGWNNEYEAVPGGQIILDLGIYPRGDVNGDFKTNTADVTLLAKYVKARGQGVDLVGSFWDVDGSNDGRVTTADVALLAKYVKARGQGVVIY